MASSNGGGRKRKLTEMEEEEKEDYKVRWFFYINFSIYDFPLPPKLNDLMVHNELKTFVNKKYSGNNNDIANTDLFSIINLLVVCFEATKTGPCEITVLADGINYFKKIMKADGSILLSNDEKKICRDLGETFHINGDLFLYFLKAWMFLILSHHFDWSNKPNLEFDYYMQYLDIIIQKEFYTHKLEIGVKLLTKVYHHLTWNGYRYRSDMTKRPKPLKQYEYIINVARSLIFQCADLNSDILHKSRIVKSHQVFFFVYPLYIEFTLDLTKWYWILKRDKKESAFQLNNFTYQLPIRIVRPDYVLPEIPYKDVDSVQSVYDHLQHYKNAMINLKNLKVMSKFKNKLPSAESVIDFVLIQILLDLPHLVEIK